MIDLSDVYYIRRVKDGHTDEFVHIVRRYQRMVFTIVSKIVSQRETAEDITQEIFLKVFQKLNEFREEAGFATWLYRIAYNTTISELRKRRFNFFSIDDDSVHPSEVELSDSVDEIDMEIKLQYLEIALKRLSPDDALLISMFYMNNHSIQDISGITGNSVANVKVKLYRIRKSLSFEINKLIQL